VPNDDDSETISSEASEASNMPKLSDEDRRAVDAIFMNGQYNTTSTVPVAAADGGLAPRINQVARLLHLLDAMPAPEPSPDLAQRTLARIDSADTTGGARPGGDAPVIATDPTVA
jgi:hypothetical protein